MNFDDLHDPDPPRPGPTTLAAVTGRARRIRRRRTTLAVAGGLVALAALVIPAALVVTGERGGDRIVPAEPATTEPPPTSAPGALRTTVPATEPAPATVAPTSPPEPVTVTVPQASAGGAVAIRVDGDAVLVAPDGTETVVHDGADPRTPPAEGEHTVVDSVIATPDGRVFVSTCCEPVPGTWFEATGEPVGAEDVVYGHGLSLSPDGTRIASFGAQGITVSDLDGAVVASADLATAAAPSYRQPAAVMWLDDDTLAVIELRQGASGDGSWLYTTDAGLVAVPDASGVRLLDGIEFVPRLAGVGPDGSILVAASAAEEPTSLLIAHDRSTLELLPASDVSLPAPAVDVWYADGPTFVDAEGAIHVGGATIDGEYTWARPVG